MKIFSTHFHRWFGNKNLSVKWLSTVVQPRFILSLPYSHLFYIAWSGIHPQIKNTLQCQIPGQDHRNTLYYVKYGVCINCGRHRNRMHLTVRTEGRFYVTYIAVLVSFHKQHCVTFNIKWSAQLFLTYWTLRPQFSVLSESVQLFHSFISSFNISCN